MLAVKNVTARYHEDDLSPALSDISFSLGNGEKLALLGNNGAGKSTLLLLLAGVLFPTCGSVSIDGEEMTPRSVETIRQKVGLVMQNPDDQLFMPTVFEDAAFGLRNRKTSEPLIREKVEAALSALGIVSLRDRLTHRLSGGEKRLAALAGVLIMEPRILLLDEPATFLDNPGRQRLIDLLAALPHAIILATHDLAMAERLCTRTIHLEHGRIAPQLTN